MGTQAGSGRYRQGDKAEAACPRPVLRPTFDLWRDAGQHPVRSQAAALRSQPQDLRRAPTSCTLHLCLHERRTARALRQGPPGTACVSLGMAGKPCRLLVGAQVPEGGSAQACSEQATSSCGQLHCRGQSFQMGEGTEACGLTGRNREVKSHVSCNVGPGT